MEFNTAAMRNSRSIAFAFTLMNFLASRVQTTRSQTWQIVSRTFVAPL